MALIDVTAEIRGESKATTLGGLRMLATAHLTGFAVGGLGRSKVPVTQAPSVPQSDPSKSGA